MPTDTATYPNYDKTTVKLCDSGTLVTKEILTQTPTP